MKEVCIVRIAIRLLIMLSLLLAAACSAPQPKPDPEQEPHVSVPDPTPSVQATPVVTTPPVARVIDPWRPGEFQKGIQVYWHYPASEHDTKDKAKKLLDYAVSLKANAIGITFPIYTDGATPTRVYVDADTPTPEQLGLVIAAAKERGLRVMVRPSIYEANITAENPNAWRGSIYIADVDQWFASYQEVLLRYVPVLIQYGVEEYTLGTELNTLQPFASHWQQLMTAVQSKGYGGTLSYAANWSGGINSAFAALGVDAYPSVRLGDDATVPELSEAMLGWMLETYPADVRARLTVQEVGIPALDGMYPHPWHWGVDTARAFNFAAQAKWFAAMYDAAKRAGLQGIYYWSLDTNLDVLTADPATDYSGSFYGRPAAESIRSAFSL